MLYDDTNGYAFEVPQRPQGKTGDEVPDALLQKGRRIIEDGVVGGYRALLSTASPEKLPQGFIG
jgi:hypothetical protein